jgi:benzoylformate decarboxylase
VRRAAKTALVHPTGPVFISLPVDVLNAERELDLLTPTRIAPRTRGDKAAVEAAADLLATAKRPILIAGDAIAHGDALNEMVEVAELLGAPVYTECIPSTCSFPFTHLALPGAVRAPRKAHPRAADAARPALLRGRRSLHAVPALRRRAHAGRAPLDPPGRGPVGDRQELPRSGGDRGRSEGHVARSHEALRRRLTPAAKKDAQALTAALGAAMDKRRRAMRETAAAEAGRTPISPLSLVAALVDALPEDAIVVDESISSANRLRELLSSRDPKSFLRDQGVDTGGHTDQTISSGVTIRRGQRERGLTSGETAAYADTST